MKKILLSLLLTVVYAQGTFSGVTYFDYTYDLSKDAINDAGFGLKRVYFTYKQDLSENISYKFQTDVGQLEVGDFYVNEQAETEVGGTKKTQFVAYLKKAQLDWKFSTNSSSKLTFGMQGMNVFNVTEKTWGFRFLQKSTMDKYKFSSSADIGIGYSGKFNNLNYSLMYTNGCGYKSSENDEHKKLSAQLVYGEKKLVKKDGFNIGTSFSLEPYDHESGETKNKTLIAFYGGYAGNGLRIGGEFDTYTDDGTDITQQIIAGYASYKISDKFEGLIYVDMYNPNTSTENVGNTDLVIGTNYQPGKGLTITPNLRISTPDEGDVETLFMMNFEFKF